MKVTLGSHKRQHRGPAVLGGPPDPGLPVMCLADLCKKKTPIRIADPERPGNQLGLGFVVVHLLVAKHKSRATWRSASEQRHGYSASACRTYLDIDIGAFSRNFCYN